MLFCDALCVMLMVVKNGCGSADGCLLTVQEARGDGVRIGIDRR